MSTPRAAGIMDELAAEFHFTYEPCSADIDEQAIRHADPAALVTALAKAKAAAIEAKLRSAGHTDGLLLTCDQVVVHEGEILEKPKDKEEVGCWWCAWGSAIAGAGAGVGGWERGLLAGCLPGTAECGRPCMGACVRG